MGPEGIPPDIKESLYAAYYDHMFSESPFYALVILNQFNKAQIYVEAPLDPPVPDTPPKRSKMRLFFRKEDYVSYAKAIQRLEEVDFMRIKRLEVTATEAVKTAMDIDETVFKQDNSGIDLIACVLIDDIMIDIDTFWTKRDKKELL
jgi:hypothetical protein